jgi:copper chaperone
MTYKGVRARPPASENGRLFEVCKVRIGPDGHVSDVLWSELDAGSDQHLGARVVASAAEVVDAIHDGARVAAVFSATEAGAPKRLPMRPFVVVEHEDGRECITFEGPPSPGRELVDLISLDGDLGMISFQVIDMTCARGADAVTNALKAVDRDAQVRVDLANFTVEIEPGSASARQLSDAIKRAGYSPVAA